MLKRKLITICVCAFFLGLPQLAGGQDQRSIVASADGTGTLKLGKEEFKLHSVVVKLMEEGKAEVNLVTDLTIFVSASWSRTSDTDKTIYIQMTASTLQGGGTLLLGEDGKSIASLKLKVINRISRKTILVDFVAK